MAASARGESRNGEFTDMTKEQAEALAAKIKAQFPFHHVGASQSADMRNAPRTWFVGVQRIDGGDALIIYSEFDWSQALLALDVLRFRARSTS